MVNLINPLKYQVTQSFLVALFFFVLICSPHTVTAAYTPQCIIVCCSLFLLSSSKRFHPRVQMQSRNICAEIPTCFTISPAE